MRFRVLRGDVGCFAGFLTGFFGFPAVIFAITSGFVIWVWNAEVAGDKFADVVSGMPEEKTVAAARRCPTHPAMKLRDEWGTQFDDEYGCMGYPPMWVL